MKTANIETPVIDQVPQTLFEAISAQVNEIRQKIARGRQEAQNKARLAVLDDYLLRDVGMEPRGKHNQQIDRTWML